jgi:hypothetical protein
VLWLSTTPWRRIGEWRYSPTHSLTSALDGGKRSASRSGHFIPRERAPGTHCIGGWVGPRAVPDAVVKRKIPSHLSFIIINYALMVRYATRILNLNFSPAPWELTNYLEAARSSEVLVSNHHTTLCNNPESHDFCLHRREDFPSLALQITWREVVKMCQH